MDSDRCAAYPDGIPDRIWLGEVSHDAPFEGDGGVTLSPRAPRDPRPVSLRHEAWAQRGVETLAHEDDPLGRLVGPRAETIPDPEAVHDAWRTTRDALAMLLVLLRAGRLSDLARAIRLASDQLHVEGCDITNDPGWLAANLCLGSYGEAAALDNRASVWSVFSSSFGNPYITARIQQTLLRSMRRVVPEPPPMTQWAHDASIGVLDDDRPALVAGTEAVLCIEDVELLEPWTRVTNPEGLEAELARELVPGHRLYGRRGLRAVARRSDSEDILFVDDTLAAVVRLTWSKDTDPLVPTADIHPSVEDWVLGRMRPDHADHTSGEPRAFAYAFRSPFTLEAMRDALPDRDRWEWTLDESQWYGEYVWAKDGATRVRIFAGEVSERFKMQIDFVESGRRASRRWFGTARALATDALLPAVDASEVEPAPPESD